VGTQAKKIEKACSGGLFMEFVQLCASPQFEYIKEMNGGLWRPYFKTENTVASIGTPSGKFPAAQ
jgi:hypothetical protein